MDGIDRNFRLLVQGITDYAIFMLDLDGRIKTWNEGAEKIKGYLPSEIIGKHFSCFYTEEDRRAGKPESALRLAKESGRFVAEGWRIRKDGSRFCASVVIDAIHDEDGKLIGFAKITRDITERRHLEAKLQQAREELFQAQKLEAVGNMTNGVAHDFNNILATIRGNVELAERCIGDDEKMKRVIARIKSASEKAANLIHQLLVFSRRQPVMAERVNVHDVVSDTVTLLEHALRGHVGVIRIVVDVSPDVRDVFADPRELELALINVGMNARDAMMQGGTLRIQACNVPTNELPGG